jgi:glycosyltransferase involved in cell wall biosynthesis
MVDKIKDPAALEVKSGLTQARATRVRKSVGKKSVKPAQSNAVEVTPPAALAEESPQVVASEIEGVGPSVSVVMPSLNQAPFLEAAVRSVLEQSYAQLELVVVDGQSTDGTVELLVHLQQEFGKRLRWVSQQDTGPAQAINTAIALSQGEIIGWLNSDDLYADDAVSNAVNEFVNKPWLEMVYGLAEHVDASGHVLNTYPTLPPSTPVESFADGSFICQPTVFMRRSALEIVGPLDESIKTAFDLDLWVRFFKQFQRQTAWIQRVQAYSRLHSACLTQKLRRQVALDGMSVVFKHFKAAPAHWFWTHLDEMCDAYPFGPEPLPLLKQLESFILDSKPYLSVDDLKQIGQQLRSDARLNLVKPGLIATVQTDGWVSHQVAVKYRWTGQAATAVTMRCVANWPEPGAMQLKIRSPQGDEQVTELDVPEEFVLRFEVPESQVTGMMMWVVETPHHFVPSRHSEASDDDRELSFRVIELKTVSD